MPELLESQKVFFLQISTALLCGVIIGLERQLRAKPIGIRTSCLICVGTTVFMSLSLSFPDKSYDPFRVLGQIVSGVGFLGAGVIINKGGVLSGITSSAVIWLLAAIGSCIGLQEYFKALSVSILCVSILIGVEVLERIFVKLRKGIYQGIK